MAEVSEPSVESLLAENALLRKEVQVARRGSEITAALVVEQFVKIEEILERLEEKVTTEEELRASLSAQNAYLAALHETTLGLMSRLDLSDLLYAITNRARQLLGAALGFVYLVEPETGAIELKVALGGFEERIGITLNPGEGVGGTVWQTGQPLIVDDYAAWSGASEKWTNDPIGEVVGIPLKSESQVMGVLEIASSVESGRTFGQEEVQLLGRFAQLASIALDNARLYQAMERARKDAESANSVKSAFLASMSHELRTPLNAIIGYSEMLIEDAESSRQEGLASDLRKIMAAGKHLLSLINDILDLSKIEAGKTEIFLETVSVVRFIEDVVSTVRPLVAKNENSLIVHCGDDLGMIHTDLTKVRQVLFNLIGNAGKFTDKGSITLDVSRITQSGQEWLMIRVADTGIGMTKAQMSRLFHAFSQVSESTRRKYGGTGLGLAISKRFCEMLGGDITAESRHGMGSAFTLRLPIRAEAPKPEAAFSAAPKEEAAREGAMTVLVIDDEHAARNLMKRFLTKEGFSVVTAASGEEGLQLARTVRPDIITLDVMMPGMDGWAVLLVLKGDPGLADIPVIMLTIVDNKNMGYTLGVSDYLIKPIDRGRLLAVIRKHMKPDAPQKVLVVDDDRDTRRVLRRMLETEGWAVVEADNGRVALQRLAEAVPAAILLDLIMPEMDGFQFLSELRKSSSWHAVPVVVVTGKDITSQDRSRLAGGVERILEKGMYTKKELLTEVRELVAAAVGKVGDADG